MEGNNGYLRRDICFESRDGISTNSYKRPIEKISPPKNMNVSDVIISALTSKEFQYSKMKIDGRVGMKFTQLWFN